MTERQLNGLSSARVTQLLRCWYGSEISARRFQDVHEILKWSGLEYTVVASGDTWFSAIKKFEDGRLN
jgi:precorrin-6B methylase 1